MAHSFDTKVRITGSGSPVTANYTCGAGATLLVLGIVVAGSVGRAGGAPTYNGVALLPVDVEIITETNCELWYMNQPPTGSALSISIPNTGSNSLFCCASSYISATGYSALDSAMGKVFTAANPSLVITPAVNGDVLVAVCGDGRDTAAIGRTHTVLYETDNGAYSDNHQYALIADTAPTTVGWTIYLDDYCIILAAFKEAASPNVTIQPAKADTYIYEAAKTTNYNAGNTLMVSPFAGNRKASIISLDLSTLVPSGAMITGATLSLYFTVVTAGRTITVYRLLHTDWVETQLTWNIYKTGSNWATAGCLSDGDDFTSTDAATVASLAAVGWTTQNVLNQVLTALASVGGVAHFVVKDEGASANVLNTFFGGPTVHVYLCPKLYIEYTVPGGTPTGASFLLRMI